MQFVDGQPGNVLTADNKDKKYIYNMTSDVELVRSIIAEQDPLKRNEQLRSLNAYINHLLSHDFQSLVSALYRMDVNEDKLKILLNKNPNQDAAGIIAQLMIQRQQQKLFSKNNFKVDENIPDDEKW